MAFVSSLDKDLRKMRLDRYTPQAANEVRAWIEEVLGDRLQSGDLLEALKNGVALCRLVNHAVSPGVKFKQSAMPFVQMENISHFLRACQTAPLNLPPHDVFLTVDLYESKDPAQVLQCISAFSRRANAINPSAFPRVIGAKSKGSVVSPQVTGPNQNGAGKPALGQPTRERGASNVSETNSSAWKPMAKGAYSGRMSPTKTSAGSPTGPVSSWSRKVDESSTAPAWNIHQYGYMGGASQGNQGITFGARRQITSAAPSVPSIAEQERRRKEEQAEAKRMKAEAEDAEQRRRRELEAEEERARLEEERRWEEETKQLREKERREAEEEKRRWDEEQRRWKKEEEIRLREERELEKRLARDKNRVREKSDARLNGQFLSQYQAEPGGNLKDIAQDQPRSTSESQRIKDLERQLELAKERERQYERERLERLPADRQQTHPPNKEHATAESGLRGPAQPLTMTSEDDAWKESEREFLRKKWQNQNEAQTEQYRPPQPPRLTASKPAPVQEQLPPQPPRPLPSKPPAALPKTNDVSPASRPLPNPSSYIPGTNRTDRYLSSNPAPAPPQPTSHRPFDYSTTTEIDLETQRRQESQAKTKAGGWASKSLLEREMERERERQREWEEGQQSSAQAVRDQREGAGPGQSWDVHQYGYLGGDSQNRGGPGLGVGGARRQIIGPRPPPR